MSRRLELLEELAFLRDDGRTPRIDTTRNRLEAAHSLLTMVRQELNDLHVLAYERHTAQRETVVSGGNRDYALDTHGNPKARNAYKQLSLAALDAVEIIAEASHNAIRILREGERDRPSTVRRIQIHELADAIENQAKRIILGDSYVPVRREPQPDSEQANTFVERLRREEKLRKDRDRLQAKVRQLEKAQIEQESA